jgi:hypothetical protein
MGKDWTKEKLEQASSHDTKQPNGMRGVLEIAILMC